MTADSAVEHVLLTKFNVPVPGGGDAYRDEAWLRGRLDLFQRMCLPSVRAQTAAFTWILLCAPDSPRFLPEELLRIGAGAYRFAVLDGPVAGPSLSELLVDQHLLDGQLLLTTRLDSDDALAPDAMRRFMRAAEAALGDELPKGFNLRNGYQYMSGMTYRLRDSTGPFASMLERVVAADGGEGRVNTVLNYNHRLLASQMPVQQIGGPPGWLQVVHGDNLENAVRGIRWGRREEVERYFRLELPPGDSTPSRRQRILSTASTASDVARRAATRGAHRLRPPTLPASGEVTGVEAKSEARSDGV